MTRDVIINNEIAKNNYKTYLEIGVMSGTNLRKIRNVKKTAVDPDPKSKGTTHVMTSDMFFELNDFQYKQNFDIIFIDGLHEANQVYKDIENALKCLNKGGTIVLHDMNPSTELMQRVPRETTLWTGDCWRAMVKFRCNYEMLSYTVDTDYGVGIIKPDVKSETIGVSLDRLDYECFDKNRKEFVGLISVEEYLSKN